MLPVTEEERKVFDQANEFWHEAGMDLTDSDLLQQVYAKLTSCVNREKGNNEVANTINSRANRAIRVLDEICNRNETYKYNRDIDEVLDKRLQDTINAYKEDYLEEDFLKDFDYHLLLNKKSLIEYINKKENEYNEIKDVEFSINILEGMIMRVHGIVYDAIKNASDMLVKLDLNIYDEQHKDAINEDNIDELNSFEEVSVEEQIPDFEGSSDWVIDGYEEDDEPFSWEDEIKSQDESLNSSTEEELTPEKFKEFAEMVELFPKIGEIKENILCEINRLHEVVKQRKLEDFKKNPEFISDLELIMKHDKKQNEYHYHGTQDLVTAGKILKEGLLMTRGLDSTAYSEFTMDELLLYQRGFGGEIGSSGIVVIDQPIENNKKKKIVEKLESKEGYSFVPSGLQGLNNKPENIVRAQYIVGYVDKINKQVVLNPLYYDYQKKLEEMEKRRSSIQKKDELNAVDIFIAGKNADIEKSDEADKVLSSIARDISKDEQEKEVDE